MGPFVASPSPLVAAPSHGFPADQNVKEGYCTLNIKSALTIYNVPRLSSAVGCGLAWPSRNVDAETWMISE